MTKYLLDIRLKEKLKKEYQDRNDIIFVQKNENLYEEISSHPDIVACQMENITIVEPNFYSIYYETFSKINSIIKGEKILSSKYPKNIAYNCVVVGKHLIGNIEYLDENILLNAKKNNYSLINVKQGYAKCSTLNIYDNAVITSDENIYKNIVEKTEIDALFVDTKDIYLSDRYNGFIGGCGGYIENELCFFGEITSLESSGKIIDFLSKYNIKYRNILDQTRLQDYGSIIEINI